MFLYKYDPIGQLLWTQPIIGYTSQAAEIMIGHDGNIYLGTSDGDLDVLKFDPNGNMIWASTLGSITSCGLNVEGNVMAMDASDNIYLVGTSQTQESAVIGKCDSAGNPQWVKYYNRFTGELDRGYGIDVDGQGNVYVAISSYDTMNLWNSVLMKYSSSGILVWERLFFSPSQNCISNFVRVFEDTSIYVGGVIGTIGYDYLTLKYDSTGQLLWSRIFDAEAYYGIPFNTPDVPREMILTHSGNIVYTGSCNNNGQPWWLNNMYDSGGNLVWVDRNFGANSNGRAIVEDANGYLIFTGEGNDTTISLGVLGLTKYDSLGNQVWINSFYTASNGLYLPKIGLDYFGNIYCSGVTIGFPASTMTTLKYDHTADVGDESSPQSVSSIYPNPVSGMATIHVEGIFGLFRFILHDQFGREILQIESAGNELQFSTEGIAAGLYYYRITQEGEVQNSGKLIIE